MGGFPISRFFRLNVDGVRCDERGLFVGGAPMLKHSARPGGRLADVKAGRRVRRRS